LAGGVDCDVAAVDQLDGAERGPSVGDAVLLGVRSAAKRNAVSERISFPGLGIITMSRPNAASVLHESLAATNASRLKISVVVLANADSSLGKPRDADLTGADDASARRFRDRVERAPLLESENALRCTVGFFPLALPPFRFTQSSHGGPQQCSVRRKGADSPASIEVA
jgi:hypothetical protein